MENSSARKKAISSPASGLLLSGLKSMRRVSMTSLMVSTSPPSSTAFASASLSLLLVASPMPSRRSVAMSSRREPLATEAGYCFAKLRRPWIAERRSSRSVADWRRPQSVSIVAVAVWSGGVFSMLLYYCHEADVTITPLPVPLQMDSFRESTDRLLDFTPELEQTASISGPNPRRLSQHAPNTYTTPRLVMCYRAPQI